MGGKVKRSRNEGGKAPRSVDLRVTLFESGRIDVGKDQPWFRPERKAQLDELAKFGMHRFPCRNLQRGKSVALLPGAHVVSGIAIWHSGLTENGVLVEDALQLGDASRSRFNQATLNGRNSAWRLAPSRWGLGSADRHLQPWQKIANLG
jgi:hypothetical protein